jgi:chemotaxis signal transduction protein
MIREVVRLDRLAVLPAMAGALAGVLDLRGEPLPVVDVRDPRRALDRPAYVLVLAGGLGAGGGEEGSPLTGGLDQQTGFVVDEVLGVLGRAELPAAGDGPPRALPAYVVDVLRLDGGPLFVVDIGRMVTALADRSDRPDQGQT